jgi:eukaryotic-like serine/threonine-protein kinase
VPPPTSESPADVELQARVAHVLAPAYDVEKEVGRGGMGIVYRAKDVRLKRVVAVKLLPPELAYRTEIRTRFLQEAETAAQLSHPNIVPIYTVDEREGLVYFVMAFIDGDNLGTKLRAQGTLAPEPATRVLKEVAQALAFAHARGVIHRDIKPDNILLADDGRAMVTDFGIARAVDETTGTRLTATGVAIGTPAYMSPEQCAGDRTIDGRSDLYALGVVGYQMLSGAPPFTGSSTPALLVKQISEAPVPLRDRRSDVPEQLANIIMKLLAKAPSDRFADANALVAALDGASFAPLPPPPRASTGASAPSSMVAPVPSFAMPAPAPAPVPSPGMIAAFSAEDMARWSAPPVNKFRKRFTSYAIINAVLVVLAIVGDSDLFGITAFWSVLMAYWYAKLWADGYDWHDVFKQPRDRLFFDVAAEAIEDAKAMFDKNKRAELRERARQVRLQSPASQPYALVPPAPRQSRNSQPRPAPEPVDPQLESSRQAAREERRAERRDRTGRSRPVMSAPPSPLPGQTGAVPATDVVAQAAAAVAPADVLAGAHGPNVRRAVADCIAVKEIVDKLGAADRALLPDVVATVKALVDRIVSLAGALQRLDGDVQPDALPALERRITECEAEPESPERERKLALLRRQQATLRDLADRRAALYAQLENAGLVLQNIRFDLLKLRSAGVQSAIDDVTSATQEARALSREIGNVLNVAQELKAI